MNNQDQAQGLNFYKFWIHVFKACREFDKQIQVENSEELVLSSATVIFWLEIKLNLKNKVDRQRCMKTVRLCNLKGLKKYTELIRIT